jgi:hypothetical protein
MVAVHGCAELRHAIDAANFPTAAIFEAASDHVATRTFNLTAADGSALG